MWGTLAAAASCFSVLREGGPACCLQPAMHGTALRHDVTSASDHYLLWVPSVFTSSFSLSPSISCAHPVFSVLDLQGLTT